MRSIAYVPGIEGLRAIAITSVVLFHIGFKLFPGGFVGVDIFFVISGFLISSQIQTELRTEGRFKVLEFYGRRIRRLLPAMALVLATTLGFAYFTLLPQAIPPFIKSAGAVLLIHSNNFFEAKTGGYFDSATDLMPLLHTWSLSVEEQIYVVWPLVLVLIFKGERRFGMPHALPIIGLVFTASLAACIWQTAHNPHQAFYLTPFRAWEFALGAGIGDLNYRLSKAERRLPAWLPDTAVSVGVIMQLASLLLIDPASEFPGYVALLPCLGTALAIFGLCQGASRGWALAALKSRLALRLGVLSYGWYLWHWPLLAMWRSYSLGQRNLPVDTALALAALILAELTYRHVENPVRQRRYAVFKSLRGTYLSAAFTMAMLTLFGHFLLNQGRALIQRTENQIGEINAPVTEFSKCTMTPEGLYPAARCTIGDPQKPVVLVWGDSHTEQIFPALQARGNHENTYLVRYYPACPPLFGVKTASLSTRQELEKCTQFVQGIKTELQEAHTPVRKVVLLARWNNYLGMPVPEAGDFKPTALVPSDRRLSPDMGQIESQKKILAEGLRETFGFFAQKQVPVYVVAPIPEYTYSIPGCLLRHAAEDCRVRRSTVETRRDAFMTTLHEVAAEFGQVKVIETIDRFCNANDCPPVKDGKSLYRDSNHLTGRGAADLLNYLEQELQ